MAEPNDAARLTTRPLNMELASPNESESDLKNTFLLATADDEPREALRLFAKLLT